MVRRRSIWRSAWVLAFALLCVYLAFDVLDLDGSDFPRQLESNVIASVGVTLETDRLCAAALPLPDLRLQDPPAASNGLERIHLPAFQSNHPGARLRSGPILARRQLSMTGTTSSGHPADPA